LGFVLPKTRAKGLKAMAITPREQQVLDIFDAGCSTDQVMLQTGLAKKTVDKIRCQLLNPGNNRLADKKIRAGSALLLKCIGDVHPYRITP
jgi:FixJ family two-component response regulator